MKNRTLLILLVSLTAFLNAQNYYVLELNVCDENHQPKQFEFASVYSKQKELCWSVSDDLGNIGFVLQPSNQNNDSIYIIFGKGECAKQDMVYLNDIHLFGEKQSVHHIITLRKFDTYTKQEFDEYRRKNQLLPDRVRD